MQLERWVVVAVLLLVIVCLAAVVVLAVQLHQMRTEMRDAAPRVRDQGHVDDPPAGSVKPVANQQLVPVPRDDSLANAGPTDAGEPSLPVADAQHGSVVFTREGRTVVLPTAAQVRSATMRRSMVRGAVVSHGIWYALRAESRDRIRGLVRREFRRRKKVRQRAARRAARHAPVGRAQPQAWLGSPASTGQSGVGSTRAEAR